MFPDDITREIVKDMREEFKLLKQSMIETKYNKQQFENFIDYTNQLDKTLNTQFRFHHSEYTIYLLETHLISRFFCDSFYEILF